MNYDGSSGVYSTVIGIRIDDEKGNFIGVMKVVLNIKEPINIIESIRPSEQFPSRYFKLLSKDGKLFYSSKKEGDVEFFKDVSGADFFKRIGEYDGSFIGHEPKEEEELFAYAHSKGYKDFKGLGWILVVEHETGEVFAPVIKLKNILLLISFILTLLAILIGISFSRSISDPIIRLKNATIEIGKGRLDTKIEIKRKDEIGILADSFNKMTSDLQKTMISRDELVKDITERKKLEEELKNKMESLERFNKLAVGRELKMAELKKRLKELEEKARDI